MDISSSLLAKGAAGTLAATAAVGTGVAAKEGLFNDFFKTNSESINVEGVENPTNLEGQQVNSTGDNRGVSDKSLEGTSGHDGSPVIEPSQQAAGGSSGTEGGKASLGTNLSNGDTVSHVTDRSDNQLQTTEDKVELNKFDHGLIDFLKNGGDIVFEVKRGDEEITADNLTLDGTNPLSLTAKINVGSGNTTNLIEKSGAKSGTKGKKETLQKLNSDGNGDGTAWAWACEIKFETTEASLEGKSINEKEKIFDSAEKGLFNLLKKELSTIDNESDKNEAKEAKEKFIRFCAKKRSNNDDIKNKETLADNKLESTISINLKLGAASNKGNKKDVTKLYPSENEDDKKFKRLFEKTTQSTQA